MHSRISNETQKLFKQLLEHHFKAEARSNLRSNLYFYLQSLRAKKKTQSIKKVSAREAKTKNAKDDLSVRAISFPLFAFQIYNN